MVSQNLEVVQIVAGPIETNAFLVIDPVTRTALIVDAPPESIDAIESELTSRQIEPILLVLTHGHWDHIGDAEAIRDRFGVQIVAHKLDLPSLENPSYADIEGFAPERLIGEGDSVELGGITFDVLHTPGHSPGQITLLSTEEDAMFGGDTLFPNGYGTIEISGASAEETVATIRRLTTLPDTVVVYPGHGNPTTIGSERSWMSRVAETGKLL